MQLDVEGSPPTNFKGSSSPLKPLNMEVNDFPLKISNLFSESPEMLVHTSVPDMVVIAFLS